MSLQAQIEVHQATIDALTADVAQLEQVRSSQEELLASLETGNQQLREQLEQEQARPKQARDASEVIRALQGLAVSRLVRPVLRWLAGVCFKQSCLRKRFSWMKDCTLNTPACAPEHRSAHAWHPAPSQQAPATV